MIQKFNNQQVAEFVNAFEAELLAAPRYKIDFNNSWRNTVDNEAGVYFIFDNDVLAYIGETANLYKRMGEIGRTYNHSFRKKLGRKLQPEAKKLKVASRKLHFGDVQLLDNNKEYFTFKIDAAEVRIKKVKLSQ